MIATMDSERTKLQVAAVIGAVLGIVTGYMAGKASYGVLNLRSFVQSLSPRWFIAFGLFSLAASAFGFFTLPFLNLAISEMQETSDWSTHYWNVMSEQRKSNWQHPETY